MTLKLVKYEAFVSSGGGLRLNTVFMVLITTHGADVIQYTAHLIQDITHMLKRAYLCVVICVFILVLVIIDIVSCVQSVLHKSRRQTTLCILPPFVSL